jgi:hypothetical protein
MPELEARVIQEWRARQEPTVQPGGSLPEAQFVPMEETEPEPANDVLSTIIDSEKTSFGGLRISLYGADTSYYPNCPPI